MTGWRFRDELAVNTRDETGIGGSAEADLTWDAGALLHKEDSSIWFGEGCSFYLRRFAQEISRERGGISRTVVVSSRGFGHRCWGSDVIQGLRGLHLDFETHDGMPTPESVARLALRIKAKQPDVVIAVGGGSVMDAAKSAAALAAGSRIDEDGVRTLCDRAECQPGIPVLAVPSTPGTGAETTRSRQYGTDAQAASSRWRGQVFDRVAPCSIRGSWPGCPGLSWRALCSTL